MKKTEDINKEIARAVGTTDSKRYFMRYLTSKGRKTKHVAIPDYCNDLNAMHVAERVLTAYERTRYMFFLYEDLNVKLAEEVYNAMCASPRQRAQAFLKAINY